MDAQRFDALSMAVAGRLSRRAALAGGGAGFLAAALGAPGRRRAAAQDATAAAEAPTAPAGEDPAFLFVQTFTGGGFRPNPGADTPEADGTPTPGGGAAYMLTLEGHHGETIYFSGRPQRVFGEAPTERFLAGLGFSPANPPNAALVAQTEQGDDVVVLELVTPAYDAAAGTLTYGAAILAEYQGEGLAPVAARQLAAALPETFGRASLFIDDCPDVSSCLHRPPGARTDKVVGPVPGGPWGQCWDWNCVCCEPCSGMSQEEFAARCNRFYAECQDRCYVNLGL